MSSLLPSLFSSKQRSNKNKNKNDSKVPYNPEHDLSLYPCVSFSSGHSSHIWDVVQLADDTLVSCSSLDPMKRWTVEGQLLGTFSKYDAYCVMEVDDEVFLTGSYDTTLQVWYKASAEIRGNISTTSGVHSMLRLRNNSSFLCGLDDGTIEERSLAKFGFEVLHSFKPHSAAVRSLCELSSGSVVSASQDKTVKEWDVKTQTVIRTFSGHLDEVWRVIELSDKTTIASASADKTIRRWEVTTGNCIQVLKGHSSPVLGLVELRDGTLLSASRDGTVREWNYHTGQFAIVLDTEEKYTCMKQLRDGSIVTGTAGGRLEVRRTWNK
eukprot:TRINITY_DN2817_c0_g1_i1.p1 TRINITY_DN2817_c0_g1~~TRINITY_DN2817_c0_g1_i1.p1  ORF type:complete len:324 (-),score=62.47 TRINITY_DN2817_c0_g1_i1:74-1045(-)